MDDCTTPARAKGLCAKHRMRQLRTGDPTMVRRPGRPKIAQADRAIMQWVHDHPDHEDEA